MENKEVYFGVLLDEEASLSNIYSAVNSINLEIERALHHEEDWRFVITQVKRMAYKIPLVWYNHKKDKKSLTIGVSSRMSENAHLYRRVIDGLNDMYNYIKCFSF